MTGWPDQPVIYEINTPVWLNGLARTVGGASPWTAWRTPTVPWPACAGASSTEPPQINFAEHRIRRKQVLAGSLTSTGSLGETVMVLDLVLIGLAIAFDPLPLTAFLIVLPSERGVRKGAAFVFGWLASLAIVVTVTVLATGDNPLSRTRRHHSPTWR